MADIDTLKTIASYLSASYANGVRLGGIIYLHRISDNRLGGSAFRNLRMFKKLSGTGTWSSTAIGTTMWKQDAYAECERREAELVNKSEFFGDVLARGAYLHRIAQDVTGMEEAKKSYLRMISDILKRTTSVPHIELRIQLEMVKEGRKLDDTSAGQEALGEIYLMRHQLNGQIERTRKDMQDALRAQDLESTRQLQALEVGFATQISAMEKQQSALEVSFMDMHTKAVEKLAKKLNDMDKEQRRKLHQKQQELKDMEESLKLMREQAAIDEARWKKQKLEAAELKKKQRANLEMNHDCEQNVKKVRKQTAQTQKDLDVVKEARDSMRRSVAGQMVNGLGVGLGGAVATMGMYTCLYCSISC